MSFFSSTYCKILGKSGLGGMIAFVVQAEVMVRSKVLVILVNESISGNLFMVISIVKVCTPIRTPLMVGLICRLALDPV